MGFFETAQSVAPSGSQEGHSKVVEQLIRARSLIVWSLLGAEIAGICGA